MAIVVIYDLSISNFHLKAMPFKLEIFTSIAVVVFLLGLLRIRRRWQGMRDMLAYSKFVFTTPLAKGTKNYSLMFTLLEIISLGAISILLFKLNKIEPQYVMPMIAVVMVLVLESVIFLGMLLKGGSAFQIGIGKNTIAWYDREMHIIYFDSLKRTELFQSDLISFSYSEDLNLNMDADVIQKESRKEFRDALIKVLEAKNVYIDDAFRNWE